MRAAPAPAPAAEPVSTRVGPRTFKVLVVDDNASIRHLVRTVLETSGLDLTVISAQDGREALTLAEIEHPDLVLLDVSMPDVDGFEVCRRLREATHTAAMPVIMLTALGGEEHVEAGLGSGADDYIAKPFRRNELIARVRRVLERTYGKDAVRAEARPAAPEAPTRSTP
jgi:DNA-binding response OmpR family regulator